MTSENHFPTGFDEWKTKPVIVIDTREQLPLAFTRLQAITGTLRTADYSVHGFEDHFGVERKSIADFVACCAGENRSRFEAELTRFRGHQFRRLLICGSPSDITHARYRSRIAPQSVWASLHAFEARYALPMVFAPTPELAAAQVEQWAAWYWRERLKEFEAFQ